MLYGTAAVAPGAHAPAGAIPPEVSSRCTHVVFESSPLSPVVATACRSSSGMSPTPPGSEAVRAASTLLPSRYRQTGRPVAKFR